METGVDACLGSCVTLTSEVSSCHLGIRSSTCPPWLQAALADIEQRIRSLEVSLPDEDETHSFAERAEHYYEKRPQLLSLLHDLHLQYLCLADRYSQSLIKSNHRKTPSLHSNPESSLDIDSTNEFSETESSLSFQPDYEKKQFLDLDVLVVEMVMANVERDILAAETVEAKKKQHESDRKIELQGSLLEVLESERMVLLGENARLAYRAAAAGEEAAAMAAELGYMRHKAAELARLVVKLREEHRVCMLGRKIEGLQSQIYGLEKRNRQYVDAMVNWEMERKADKAEMERLRAENKRLAEVAKKRRGTGSWWGRIRRIEWAPCVPPVKKGKSECFYM
ncbi:kinase-interacting family protein-like [Carex rostrata]